MKIILPSLLLISLFVFIDDSFAQNLVPNPSFEITSDCPDNSSQIVKALGWTTPLKHEGTSDLFHFCSSSYQASLPVNSMGTQNPKTGDAMAGLVLFTNDNDEYREYLEVELTKALDKDETYEISFFYSLAETSKWTTNSLGIYLSEKRFANAANRSALPLTPQIQNTIELSNVYAWTKLSFLYTATGNEKHLIIGNFNDNNNTPLTELVPGITLSGTYIYLDDFSLSKKVCNLSVNLGEELNLCENQSLLLDANNEGAEFKWQDGSSSPTYRVTEPGDYWVEVSNKHCSVTDEVHVKDIPIPSFSLGNDTSVCLGDPIQIMVDGYEDSYRWQDGSHSSSYLATHPGQFWAEVDYECGTVRESVIISPKDCSCNVYIPNSFTPNEDDLNSEFSIISTCDLEEFNLRIFNRWGDEVFESQQLSDTWIGEKSDLNEQNGRYQYVVTYRFRESSETTEIKGSVLVMK